MDVPFNAEAVCTDGVCGKTTRVVLRPKTQEITHVVVKESNAPYQERMIPVEWIVKSSPERIDLNCAKERVAKAQNFTEIDFVKVEVPQLAAYEYGYSWAPFQPRTDNTIRMEREAVPSGEMAIRRGAHVEATDGRIGRVDELIVDPATEKISHIVLRKGHLWGQRDVIIPVDQVEIIEEDIVRLKLDKEAVEKLPTEPVKHTAM